MTTTSYTPEQIRAMEGPALTRLAWELKLDPHDPVGWRHFGWEKRSWGEAALDAHGSIWRPHERVDQADAVLRHVRTLGYGTCVEWFPGESGLAMTWSKAPALDAFIPPVEYQEPFGGPDQPTEALALLRVAVLAVASDLPEVAP